MTTIKKVEDLTLDEIKEQMALYQRLYYHRTKGDRETKANRNESRRRWYNKKKAEREKEKEEKQSSSDEPPRDYKDMRKYKKDVSEAYILA